MPDFKKETFILLDGQPFEFTKRTFNKSKGGTVEQTLNRTAVVDNFEIKRKWTFSFLLDAKSLYRLEKLFDKNGSISFQDYDRQTYTVLLSGEWTPEEIDYIQQLSTIDITLQQV